MNQPKKIDEQARKLRMECLDLARFFAEAFKYEFTAEQWRGDAAILFAFVQSGEVCEQHARMECLQHIMQNLYDYNQGIKAEFAQEERFVDVLLGIIVKLAGEIYLFSIGGQSSVQVSQSRRQVEVPDA